MKIRPPVKIHGGKYYLAQWIISHFPENYEQMNYLEPYCGAASVLLNKRPSDLNYEETINDLDPGIVNIFKTLRDQPQEFISQLKRLKYSKQTFNAFKEIEEDQKSPLGNAVCEFVLRRMSRGGLKKAFAWSDRERGGQPGDVNAWETAVNQVLPSVAKRVKAVYIFNKPAVQMIEMWNNPNTLVYVDPPYLHSTRVSKDVYKLEMVEADHIELANLLNRFQGKVIISGYYSRLYGRLYKGWKCVKKKIANHSSQQKIKSTKIEVLWKNF